MPSQSAHSPDLDPLEPCRDHPDQLFAIVVTFDSGAEAKRIEAIRSEFALTRMTPSMQSGTLTGSEILELAGRDGVLEVELDDE